MVIAPVFATVAISIPLTFVSHVYDAPGNAGIVVGSIGLEVRGPDGPGFFHCDGQC